MLSRECGGVARVPRLVLGGSEEEVGGGRRDPEGQAARLRFSFAATDDFPARSGDTHIASLFLSHCVAAIWRISLSVLRCHVLPCSSFNFLIEKKMYYGCLFFGRFFFFFFFLCDQF